MAQRAIIDLQYLPCLAYFSVLQKYGTILLERHEHYVKQSYRNRCYVNTVHGTEALIIPLTGKHGKTLITEVRPDYSQKWLNKHWRTIQSAYGKAPFFEFYADDLHAVMYQRFEFLYDLNRALLTMCLRWLALDLDIGETLSYEKQYHPDVRDLRSYITPGNTEFVQRVYNAVPYHQIFGNTFAANLSVLDVVFCCGPEASRIISSGSKRE